MCENMNYQVKPVPLSCPCHRIHIHRISVLKALGGKAKLIHLFQAL